MTMVGTYMLDYQVNGRRTRRPGFPPGNRAVFPQVAPHNTYRCAGNDRVGQHWWVFIACETQAQFEALCALMHQPGLAPCPAVRHQRSACRASNELDAIIGRWTRARRVTTSCVSARRPHDRRRGAKRGDRVGTIRNLQHREMFRSSSILIWASARMKGIHPSCRARRRLCMDARRRWRNTTVRVRRTVGYERNREKSDYRERG